MKDLAWLSDAMGGVTQEEAESFYLHAIGKEYAFIGSSVTSIRNPYGKRIDGEEWAKVLIEWLKEDGG